MRKTHRIGQIVPSSNVTMETEIPAMLRARELVGGGRFTFHSSRMRMKHVTRDELAAVPLVEALTGKPVVTAVAATWQMLKALGIEARVPGGGALLSGAY